MLDEIGFENTLNAKLAYALRFDNVLGQQISNWC